jgi:RNA polymerase sigma-70 factor, ECF subfamily
VKSSTHWSEPRTNSEISLRFAQSAVNPGNPDAADRRPRYGLSSGLLTEQKPPNVAGPQKVVSLVPRMRQKVAPRSQETAPENAPDTRLESGEVLTGSRHRETLSGIAISPIERLPRDAAVTIRDIVPEREGRTIPGPDFALMVARVVEGDAEAIEQLARHCLRPAYSVALAIVRRPADAEDVAQDALTTALERIETCREPERFMAWLMTIVRNQSKNWLERRRLRDVPPQAEMGEQLAPVCDFDSGLERDRLIAALGQLSGAEREVVLLHDLEGFTHQEISEALGVSCVMSRQHLFVARRKLRAVLDNEVHQGGDYE